MTSTRILVLGSGMVARPCVEYLSRRAENEITVACRNLATAVKLVDGLPHTKAICLDVTVRLDLVRAIAAADLVISLVPYTFHAGIIEVAIANKTHVVTTSYASPAIRAHEQGAKDAGVILVNEVGVDPGVDHLYAIKAIDEIHSQGGQVKEFLSFCGGLPAPESVDNPLGMKFSWSPRGVLLSQCNSASFLKDGRRMDIPSSELMATAEPYHVLDGYDFLAYPNRDSTPFQQYYNIPEACTVVRGSLRYNGNPQLVRALLKIGYLDAQHNPWLKAGMTWAEITSKVLGSSGSSESSLIACVKTICSYAHQHELELIISGFRWMGLFSNEPVNVQGTLLDTLANHLEKTMSFKQGERDLVVLQHKFVIEWENGTKETRTSTLELFGDPAKYSGMSLSVGLTCGIATQLVLDRHVGFTTPGLLVPYTAEICSPIREKLELEGIKMVERTL